MFACPDASFSSGPHREGLGKLSCGLREIVGMCILGTAAEIDGGVNGDQVEGGRRPGDSVWRKT